MMVKSLCLLLLTFYAVSSALAVECTPAFPNRNQLPPAAIFLELTALSPCTVAESVLQVQAYPMLSNSVIAREIRGHLIIIDQERVESHLILRYGLSAQSDLGIELNYIAESKGSWDGAIEDYHNWMGFPRGDRPHVGKNEYTYIQHNPSTNRTIEVADPQSGLGEPVLTFRRQEGSTAWEGWPEVVWGWRLAAKLPWGRDSPTLGSGALDAGAGVMFDTTFEGDWFRTGMFADAGVVYQSDTDAAVYPVQRWVPQGSLGLVPHVTENTRLILQFQLSAPRYYGTPLAALYNPEVISLIGARYHWGGSLITLGFTEDFSWNSEDIAIFVSFTSAAD